MRLIRKIVWPTIFLALAGSATANSKNRHGIQAAKSAPQPRLTAAPGASPTPSPTPCDPVQRRSVCELLVDADHKEAKSATVHNGAKVTVRILNQPFASCSISGENRVPEKPETPLASLLGALTPIGPVFPGGALFLADVKSANSLILHAMGGKGHKPGLVPDPAADAINRELDRAEQAEQDIGKQLDSIRQRYSGVNDQLNQNLGGPFANDSDLNEKISKSKTAIDAELNSDEDFASLDRIVGLLTELDRRIRAYEVAHPHADDVIKDMNQRIDKLNGKKEQYAEAEKLLQSARDQLRGIREYLTSKTFALSQTIELVPDKNSTTSGNLTCTDDQTKAPWGQDVALAVTYNELPAWSFSAGVLFSSLGRLQYGIRPQATSPPPAGPLTGTSKIVVTDRSSFQIIPFSFMNYKFTDWVWKERQFAFSLSGGLGANPNNGDTQAEFFEGVSLSIGNVSIYLGCHTGRRQRVGGGFNENQTVDPSTVAPLPINHIWWNQPAVGISYRIPLGS